jgi:exonuclease III
MSESLMVWNVDKGGYKSYEADPNEPPERFEDILKFLHEQRENNGVRDFILSDTFLWDRYGESDPETGANPGLAAHLGMRAAFHTRLEDEYLASIGREGVGITIATDHDVISSKVITLGKEKDPRKKDTSRKGLLVDINVGGRALTLGGVYLPEIDPKAQLRQVIDFEGHVNPALAQGPDIPVFRENVILGGDENRQPEKQKTDSPQKKRIDRAVSLAAFVAPLTGMLGPKAEYYGKVARTLNSRKTAERLRAFGYKDTIVGPTVTTLGKKIFQIDHASVKGENIKVIRARIEAAEELSDHDPLIIDYEMISKRYRLSTN